VVASRPPALSREAAELQRIEMGSARATTNHQPVAVRRTPGARAALAWPAPGRWTPPPPPPPMAGQSMLVELPPITHADLCRPRLAEAGRARMARVPARCDPAGLGPGRVQLPL